MTKERKIDWLKLLKTDVSAFNKARKENPEIIPNLQGFDFRKVNLREANFRGINFRGVDFHGTSLEDVNFQDADLREGNIRESNLQNANFQDADLREANFDRIIFWDVNLDGAKISYGGGYVTVRFEQNK